MTRIDLLSNPMTTAEDIIVGGASGVPERLAAGSEGDVLTIDSGVVAWAAAAGGGLTSAAANGTTDQTLSADTETDLTSLSVSLAAGTWIIWGKHHFERSANAAYSVLRLTDGSNAKVDQSKHQGPNSAFTICHTVIAIVTPGSTTTYKLRGQNGNGGSWRYSPDAIAVSAHIIALKIA